MAQQTVDFSLPGDDTTGALRKLDNNVKDHETRLVAAQTAATNAGTAATNAGNAAAAAQTTANTANTTASAAMPKAGGTFTGSVTFSGAVALASNVTTSGVNTWNIGATCTFSSTPTFSSGIQTNGINTKLGTSGNYGANKYNFMWASGNFALYIDSTGIGNLQFSTSDYRIKKNVEYVTTGDLNDVLAGKPCTWEYRDIAVWTADGVRHRGFIAHELQDIDPLLATGLKDAVDADGNIIVQQLDPIALISKLWGALQEEAHLRMALEDRVAALEGSSSP